MMAGSKVMLTIAIYLISIGVAVDVNLSQVNFITLIRPTSALVT